jgi:hypothetical protein
VNYHYRAAEIFSSWYRDQDSDPMELIAKALEQVESETIDRCGNAVMDNVPGLDHGCATLAKRAILAMKAK